VKALAYREVKIEDICKFDLDLVWLCYHSTWLSG